MPSPLHNGIAELFRLCPQLAPVLIQDILYLQLPPFGRARPDAPDFGSVRVEDYRSDVLILLESLQSAKTAVAGVIAEVQCGRDRRKYFTWPDYVVHGRARHECPFYLLVVAVTPSVARFCNRMTEIGHPGFAMRPLVVGPAQLPRAFSVEEARKSTALAVLSVICHGKTEYGLALAKVVVEVALQVEDQRLRGLFLDLVMVSVGKITRKELQERMGMEYEYQSPFMKKLYARAKKEVLKEQRDEGRKEGLKEGLDKGLKQGLDKGLKKGQAAAVLKMLRARGLHISRAVQKAILGCSDIQVLDGWIRRAMNVQRAEDLLESS